MSVHLEVVRHDALSESELAAIVQLCTQAFGEPFDEIIRLHTGGAHVLGTLDGVLVSHASWVPRLLQPDGLPMLQTAYVEEVATHPAYQKRGFGSAVMRRLAEEIQGFELGALATGYIGFYERLGWEVWRGKTAIRTPKGIIETPNETVMILRLPSTPALDTSGLITAEWREGELW
jgi:aminoglycoside 2'-N-acetyltransferase I